LLGFWCHFGVGVGVGVGGCRGSATVSSFMVGGFVCDRLYRRPGYQVLLSLPLARKDTAHHTALVLLWKLGLRTNKNGRKKVGEKKKTPTFPVSLSLSLPISLVLFLPTFPALFTFSQYAPVRELHRSISYCSLLGMKRQRKQHVTRPPCTKSLSFLHLSLPPHLRTASLLKIAKVKVNVSKI
jgi:hypothetical protein